MTSSFGSGGPLSLPFVRILSSPAAAGDAKGDPLRRAILAGLLDAGVRGSTVASLWLRREPWSPLEVMIAGALTPMDQGVPVGGARPLLFPLGATGVSVTQAGLSEALSPFRCWRACGGDFDPLLEDVEEAAGRAEARWSATPFDDVVGYLAHVAFAWLVTATPVSDEVVASELDTLRRQLYRLHQGGQVSESDAIDRERKQKRFRELSRAGAAGVWDLSISVGTRDEHESPQVASVLCTAAEQSGSAYKIRPLALSIPSPLVDIAAGAPAIRATLHLTAALVRPPESELPGFRTVIPPAFDTTPEEHARPGGGGVELCTVLDRFLQGAGRLSVSLDTLNRHTFVCGATGSGKSQTVRSLLESMSRRPEPVGWMVIEPAKAEYARMAGRLQGLAPVLVIRPGDRDAPPGSLNPLEPASLEPGNPERTFPLQGHADLVRALFLAAFQAEEPFPQVLSRALGESYAATGWDLVSGDPLATWDAVTGQPSATGAAVPRFPTLATLQARAAGVVEAIGYDEDIRKRVRGFVDVRIGSLRLGAPGRFFEGGHPLDVAGLLRRNVVFELEGVTNDQDKAFVMGAILIRVYEHLLLEERERFLRDGGPAPFRHLTIVEEAHRLLRNVTGESPAAHSLELFASLLAEVRAYGEGIVVVEQIPSKLIPDVIKNTALKVVHRLPAADDRFAVGATMNLSEAQSQYVVSMQPGIGAIFTDGMDRPVLGRIDAGTPDRESAAGAERLPPLDRGRRRSAGCGARCVETPCTLLSMRRAELLLADHPELTLWAEVSCMAHLIGYQSPGLAATAAVDDLGRGLAGDARPVECAIAHAVEQAIGDRYSGISPFFDPDSLAHHLAQAAVAAIVGTGLADICRSDRGRFRAGRARFADIESWLGALAGQAQVIRSHEESVSIAAERGAVLPPGNAGQQRDYLAGLAWRRYSPEAQRELLLGDSRSRLLAAAAGLVGAARDEHELIEAAFKFLRWGDPKDGETLAGLVLGGSPAPRPEGVGADGR